MRLTDVSVNRFITAIMISIALIILGIFSATKMPLALIPDIDFPAAMIMTQYPNVGPKEVETNITQMVEESVASINNVQGVTSTSTEGISLVTLEFSWGYDMALAVSDIREKLDQLKMFLPDDAENPIVMRFSSSMMPVMMLTIKSNQNLSNIRSYAEDTLKSLLEQVDGVASTTIMGGYENEVRVELDRNRMQAYNLSINNVISLLQTENRNIAGGEIKTETRKYTLRTKGEFTDINSMRSLVVAMKDGIPVYLRDIARIYETQAEKTDVQRFDGKSAVSMAIYKQSDKNTVIVADNVLKKIEAIKSTLPAGMEVVTMHNSAEYIKRSVSAVQTNAIFGGILAVLVVFLFLRNIRAAIVLGFSIPLSIVVTFILMYFFGFTLNMMSMGGLAIGVGMLIDNSIVVLENIFRFRERGARPNEAAKLGADEMAMAITASTLTTIVVFLPFLFSEGMAKQLFTEMAITISFSLICSLVIALTLVPTLTAKFIKEIHVNHKRFKFFNNLFYVFEDRFVKIEKTYGKIIHWALFHRKQVVFYTLGAIVLGFIFLFLTGMEFMPESSENQLRMQIKLPIGTNLDTTESVLLNMEKKILSILDKSEYTGLRVNAGGSGMMAAFGGSGDSTGSIELYLRDRSKRKMSDMEIRNLLRKELSVFPGAIFSFSRGRGMGGMGGSGISIEVYGYDLDRGKVFAEEIRDAVKDISGLVDVSISREEGLPEKTIVIDREKVSKMGLNPMSIADMIKYNVAGKTATSYRKEGKELDIVVRLREEDRRTIDDILDMPVITPSGKSIKLGNFAKVVNQAGPQSIERKKQERIIYVECKAEGRPLNTVVGDIRSRIDKLVKPTNFHVNIGGSFEDMNETFGDLGLALLLAILLIYVIMASQFESLYAPFIIMFTIPTMVFGVMLFLFLTGSTFNVISFVGILMLSGIVVNNGIVFIDYTNILRARGYNLHDALIEAGSKRLRPILMTTFTTIIGLVPMALGLTEGSEYSTPLARAVLGGMSSSFIFTLIFLPVVYSLMEGFKNKLARIFKRHGA